MKSVHSILPVRAASAIGMRTTCIRVRRSIGACLAGLVFGLVLAGFAQAVQERVSEETLVYVGTYTGAKSEGIYVCHFDEKSGSLAAPILAAETANPTFLAVHPNRSFLYAANEIGDFEGKKSGAVSAYAIDPETGRLALLSQQPSGGAGPCHLIVDKAGKNVLVANYGGGSVAVLPIQTDGRLGAAATFIQHHGSSVNPQRQEGPHAHCVTLDQANRFAYVCDLGLDKVMVYRFDPAQGTLVPNQTPWARIQPGSGPRHLAFDPRGRRAYVINEMKSTITVFECRARKGELRELQTISTLPPDFTGNSTTAEIEIHPSGKFLYGSNRGHDSLAIFGIDTRTGKLTALGYQSTKGRTPRNFSFDPTGHFLLAANQDSNNIVVFRVNSSTGQLEPTGQEIEVGAPVCIKCVRVASRR
ncbi:MAG: lactonase family protein [Candidatus Omnitrophica bacterium]|nr:lactonase family protein [Candidatus Omnitrophota bacterium]